jgi:nucleotide-binding universal stress UspA family protein
LPSRKALEYARRFAESFGGELVLLHAVQRFAIAPFPEITPQMDDPAQELEDTEKSLQALKQKITRETSLHVESLIRTGLPAHEIVEAAKDIDADLIVIATHGYTGWKHFCIGSTAERVVRAAPCPVFVVREKEHELV